MSLFVFTPLPSMSLFVTNFEYLLPYSGDAIFKWPFNESINIPKSVTRGREWGEVMPALF